MNKIFPFALTLLAAATLAACAVGPDYQAPTVAAIDFHNADPSVVSGTRPEVRWWGQFGDAPLQALIHTALANNLDLRIALGRVQEARALFRDQALDQFPIVTASAAGSKGEAPLVLPTAPGATGPRVSTESTRLGFDAAWELDLFGRVRRGTEAARADALAAQSSLHEVQLLVASEVARNYFEWRGNGQRLDVARRNRDSQAETLRLTQVRLNVGRGTPLDVASAQARLSATQADIPQLETLVKRSEHRLAVLVGERPGEWQPPPPAHLAAITQSLPVGSAEDLLQQRPDIARAAAELHAATARVGVAKADYFPRLSVNGFAGFVAGSFGNAAALSNRAWSAGPSLSWSAFDLGSVAARVDAADARSRQAASRYEQTVLTALEETENAFVGVSRSRERLNHTLQQAEASRKAAEIARVQYQAGAIDFLVLLDAERTLLVAEDAVAQAEASTNLAAVALYKALGGGWG